MHHISIRTANIHRAMAFYELLGFVVEERFTTGYTLACWMGGELGRIELIQIPEPRPVADAFGDEHYVGYYHISFDLSSVTTDLVSWLAQFRGSYQATQEANSVLDLPLKMLLEPEQQQIGDRLYEVLFLADTDGLPLEFIRAYPQNS